jgi:hypothetical protein
VTLHGTATGGYFCRTAGRLAPHTMLAMTPSGPASLGSVLAAAVRRAGTGQPAEPRSVEHVLNDLAAVGGGSGYPQPPGTALASLTGFAAWLTPQHQASVGLVQVAAGAPGLSAVRPGDVVVGAVTPGGPIVGIVGDDGTVYNGGPICPAAALTSVQGVYRPISSQSALWGTPPIRAYGTPGEAGN